MKTILLLFISISCHAQKLHHQMISSIGTNSHVSGGIVLRQTVGQQSVIGNSTSLNFIVGQGFQQSNKLKPLAITEISIITTTYPNPFIDKINFKFSAFIQGPISVQLFDLLGRLVYSADKYPVNNIVTINDLFFANGEYFVKLTANNFTYSTNLLKIK